MSDDESAFWDAVDTERQSRKGEDNKVFLRFLLIPLADFRKDFIEWGKGNVKSMNSQLLFLERKAGEGRMPADRIDYIRRLMEGVRGIDKKINSVVEWLDGNVKDDGHTVDFDVVDFETLSDDVHNKVFTASSEIFKELKEYRNQIDLLLDFVRLGKK